MVAHCTSGRASAISQLDGEEFIRLVCGHAEISSVFGERCGFSRLVCKAGESRVPAAFGHNLNLELVRLGPLTKAWKHLHAAMALLTQPRYWIKFAARPSLMAKR